MIAKKLLSLLLALSLAAAALLPAFSAWAEEGTTTMPTADRVYFFNISGNGAPSGDFIIVESQGHFGLIDAGHRYADTIEDADGTVYTAESSRNLSCQIPYKNGRDAAQYMIDSLGVTHLDFIIGTHAHSDHIGGVPEIAALTFEDETGEARHLVDENTVYLYKTYQHINDLQDDIAIQNKTVNANGTVRTGSWHNQAYVHQAVSAMQSQGCAVAELSRNIHIRSSSQPAADYSEAVEAVNSVEGLSEARYYRGLLNDYYDDFFIFQMGNLSIRLYNLYLTDTVIDENVNSLVAVITDGSTKVVSLSDINTEKQTEQKLARAIYDDVGEANLVKAAHHGAVRGSNSRGMLEALQPEKMVVTRNRENAGGTNGRGSFSAAMVYARKHYQTEFYEVGASDFGVVAEFAKGKVNLFNLSGEGEDTALTSVAQCKSTLVPVNGWSHWTVEMGEPDTEELCYLRDGKQIANWYQDGDFWYYIDEHSQYQYGWQTISGEYYYFAKDTYMGYPLGAMVTGWNYIDKQWYYFDAKGRLASGWTELPEGWFYFDQNNVYLRNGWYQLGGYWYYFDYSGVMQTGWFKLKGEQFYLGEDGKLQLGWQKIGGAWYYFADRGVMATGWQKLGGSWYYFKGDGKMTAGWQNIGSRWYYFDGSGAMLTGWQKLDGNWYYFDTNGAMQTGWQKISKKWYYFSAAGVMQTGWQKISKKWYYFSTDGVMQTGWQQLAGKWYYFDKAGAMVTGKKTISGKQYTFNASGVWVK